MPPRERGFPLGTASADSSSNASSRSVDLSRLVRDVTIGPIGHLFCVVISPELVVCAALKEERGGFMKDLFRHQVVACLSELASHRFIKPAVLALTVLGLAIFVPLRINAQVPVADSLAKAPSSL